MPHRTYTCADCGVEFQKTTRRGGRPMWCLPCREKAPRSRPAPKIPKPLNGRSCSACGREIDPLRDRRALYCSGGCKEWARRRPGIPRPLAPTLVCGYCGDDFQPRPKAQIGKTHFCSDQCRWRVKNPNQPRWTVCVACGAATLVPSSANSKGCLCVFCRRRRLTEAARMGSRRRKDLIRAASVPGVVFTHLEIFERDSWICQLCGLPVDQDVRHPQLRSASLDHDLPLSRGGLHVPENVQLAHLSCNVRKRNRVK